MAFEQTENIDQYRKYKTLKNKFLYRYKEIDLIKAIAIDLIEIIVCGKKSTIPQIGDALLRRLHTDNLVEAFMRNKTVFSHDYPKRKDHVELAILIQQEVEKSELIFLKYRFKFWFNPILFLKNFFIVTKQIKGISLFNKLYLAARLLYFSRMTNTLHNAFQNVDLQNKIYVPFSSCAYNEALLTLFFTQKEVKTFHIFHGFFGRWQQKMYLDVVAGENILAHTILAFSETQKNDLIRDFGIDAARIFVAGHPKYPEKKISMNTTFKSCIILGGIKFYDEFLEQLLKLLDGVASELEMQFYLKPHPNSDIIYTSTFQNCKNIALLDKTETLKQIFISGKYDCAITHNTSSYSDCMYYNIIPLRWGIGENLNFEGFDDKFFDMQGLKQLIIKYKQMDKEDFNNRVSSLLKNSYGIGINNYKELIR